MLKFKFSVIQNDKIGKIKKEISYIREDRKRRQNSKQKPKEVEKEKEEEEEEEEVSFEVIRKYELDGQSLNEMTSRLGIGEQSRVDVSNRTESNRRDLSAG